VTRWRKLSLDLEQVVEVFQAHSAKLFHDVPDCHVVRVESRLMGDPCMVLLEYGSEGEREHIVDGLLGAGFIMEEIVVEPDV
jgi:hypothetical protein